jgi:MoaA/NifB/PqqE/SkfB family radical SAM enzyme
MQRLGVKAVQVSLDGASRATFNRMRVLGEFNRAVDGVRALHAAGVPIEINYSPTRFNVHEIGDAVDLAFELGAYSFYTGRTMHTGNAVKTWHKMAPSEEQYEAYFATLHAKADEYRGRMRVYFHEMGLLEELRYRLRHPAALVILLPNGLVKLINALPFVCGDLRRQSLTEVWARFQHAWRDPRVAKFVEELATDPGKTRTLHQWVHL